MELLEVRDPLRKHGSQVLLFFQLLRLVDVFDGQEDQGGLAGRREHTAGVEQYRSPADRREVVLDLEVLEHGVLRQDLLQKMPKPRDVPLAGPEVEDQSPL